MLRAPAHRYRLRGRVTRGVQQRALADDIAVSVPSNRTVEQSQPEATGLVQERHAATLTQIQGILVIRQNGNIAL
jgi:hypothetical protein